MQRQRWRQTSCWDAPFWVEARRRPRARVSARMTARSCVLLPRHPDEVTTVVPRRRGNEAISMFHLPKPGRLILKSEHGRKSVSAGRYMPAERRRSTGEPHRRRLPTAASTGGGRFAPSKDLNCAFRVRDGRAGDHGARLLVGLTLGGSLPTRSTVQWQVTRACRRR